MSVWRTMRFGDQVRSTFWLVVLTLLGICAYLQARGLSTLVADTVVPSEPPDAAAPVSVNSGSAADQSQTPPRRARSAQAILDRNIFDSLDGPLEPYTENTEQAPAPVPPLRAPRCEHVAVTSTVQDTDPYWSTAVLREPQTPRGRLRRVGDVVTDGQVLYIGYNPSERSPAVWLNGEDGLCQALLFVDPSEKPSLRKAKRTRKPKANRRGGRGKRRRPPPLPRSIAQRIQRVSATEFLVDRRAVDAILERQAELMRSVRIQPNQQNGKTTSLTIRRVPPDSLLGKLGLKNGDRVVSVNGHSLTNPERALAAYARLRKAERISLTLERRGRPVVIDYRIR